MRISTFGAKQDAPERKGKPPKGRFFLACRRAMTWVVGEYPPDCHNVERYRIIKRSVYSAPCFRYDLHEIIAFLLSFFNLTQPK